MAKKGINWRLWSKVTVGGLFIGVGGPMLTAWLSPSEEELRAKYNPDLRKRSLENRAAAEQDFDEFVTKLKEWSKSDKPIWVVAEEDRERHRQLAIDAGKEKDREAAARREQMKKEAVLGVQPEAPPAKQTTGWSSWIPWK
jgi:hypothetical protein